MSGEFSTSVANWRSRWARAAVAAASVTCVSTRSQMSRMTASEPSGRCASSRSVETVDSTWISRPSPRTCTDSDRLAPCVRSSSRARSASSASAQRSRNRSPRGRPSASDAKQPYCPSAAGFMKTTWSSTSNASTASCICVSTSLCSALLAALALSRV